MDEPGAKGEVTDQHISHPHLDALSELRQGSSTHHVDGGITSCRTHSLELLGFSGSRTRRVESDHHIFFHLTQFSVTQLL